MKNLVILVLVIVAIASQVFGQTKKEKIDLVESQIKTVSSDLKKSEKDFERSKAKQLAEWKKELRGWQIRGSRSDNKDEIAAALKATTQLKSQIDSLTALESNEEIDAQKLFLQNWQDKKNELIAQFVEADASEKVATAAKNNAKTGNQGNDAVKKEKVAKATKEPKEKADIYDRRIPTEVTNLHYGRRSRSFDLQREDTMLEKVKNNLPVSKSSSSDVEFKVILHNMYISPVEFRIFFSNGKQYTSFMVFPGKKQVESFFLPDAYTVRFFVNGRETGSSIVIHIDGNIRKYDNEECGNYVYMSRF